MLFNSFEFIGVFLPAVLGGFYLLSRKGRTDLAIYFLAGASIVFYGWWSWKLVGLLTGSVLVNYLLGRILARRPQTVVLVLGIVFNLGLLGWFKYANFFVDTVNGLADTSFDLDAIALPIAISFFTFQQIAFLVDVQRGLANEPNIGRYGLFVMFFPQLIAGPIVHHSEILPQYSRPDRIRLTYDNVSVGLTIFTIGMFKKVALADPMGVYADIVFDAANHGDAVSFVSAWAGSGAFALEIYFDFSGYSDMAIGLARMFAIRLPLNFDSPYKAINIIEFWRRWHMTLSRFLRDYLYFPLGGNRKGPARRYLNLMMVMLLGGLWHGAAWTFVIWGGVHGAFLVVNHAWRAARRALGQDTERSTAVGRAAGRAVTLAAVVFAWSFFRAETWDGAMVMVMGMLGSTGILLPESYASHFGALTPILEGLGVRFGAGLDPAIYPTLRQFSMILALFAFVLAAPSTQEWMARSEPALNYAPAAARDLFARLQWQPSAVTGILMSGMLIVALGFLLSHENNAFIYFQF